MNVLKIILISICSLLLLKTELLAEFQSPELTEIYPAGASKGTSLQVKIVGDALININALVFSHPDIKAERVALPNSKVWDEARYLEKTFNVIIPENVKEGFYDVRVSGYFGLSSPRLFQVSSNVGGSEINSEHENIANNSIPTATTLPLEAIANGKIAKNKADYYKVSLNEKQRVLIHCWAIRLGSKLDATLSLYDSDGQKITSNNDYVGRDPLLDFTASKKGDYYIAVADQTWDGETGFVYRLVTTEKPYIETIFPAVAMMGMTHEHTLYGRNLPNASKTDCTVETGSIETLKVSIKAPTQEDDILLDGNNPLYGRYEGFNYSLENSNVFRLGLTDHPILMESKHEKDTLVTVPSEIVGTFDHEEDIDQYVFSANKGDSLWIEVISDRQFVKSDPFLIVEKIDKNQTTEILNIDDFKQVKTQGMYDIHSYDVGKELLITSDSHYRILIGDNFSKFGVLQNYRIILSHSKPDFELLTFVEQFLFEGDRRTKVYPGSLQLRPNGILPIRIRAFRKGGNSFPIQLKIEGLPEGITAYPANIFPGEEEAYLVLKADSKIKPWQGNIKIFGSIEDGSKKIERESIGATLNWSGYEITYGYTQRLNARRTHHIPLNVLAEEPEVPISLGQKDPEKIWEFKKNQRVDIPLVATRKLDTNGAVTVMEFGASDKLSFPFRIFISADKEINLSVVYNPNANNPHLLGEGSFILRGWADIMYESNKLGFDKIKTSQSKIDKKLSDCNDLKKKTDLELTRLRDELAQIPTDSKDETHKHRQTELNASIVNLKQTTDAIATDLKELLTIQTEIQKEFKETEKISKETKFRAGFYSQPLRYKIIDDEKKVVSK